MNVLEERDPALLPRRWRRRARGPVVPWPPIVNVVLGALQLMLVLGSRGQCHGGAVVLLVVPLLATQLGLCLFAAFARAGHDRRDPRAARWSLGLTLLGLSLAAAAVLTLLANGGV